MGSKKIEVSRLGLIASTNIRAQLGIRRMSNRELARQMDRSESYVRARVNDEKEWTLNDLEIICRIWHMEPCQLVLENARSVPDVVSDDVVGRDGGDPVAEEEERKRALVMAKLHRGDVHLAAYEDPHKLDPDIDDAA